MIRLVQERELDPMRIPESMTTPFNLAFGSGPQQVMGHVIGNIGLHQIEQQRLHSTPEYCGMIRAQVWSLTALPCGLRVCTIRHWDVATTLAHELNPYGDLSNLTAEQRQQVSAIVRHHRDWDEAFTSQEVSP